MSTKAQFYTTLVDMFPFDEVSPFYAGKPPGADCAVDIFDLHILLHNYDNRNKDAMDAKDLETMCEMGMTFIGNDVVTNPSEKDPKDRTTSEGFRPFQDFVRFIMKYVDEAFKTAHTVALCADTSFQKKHPKDLTRLKRMVKRKTDFSKAELGRAVFDYNDYVFIESDGTSPRRYLEWTEVMENVELVTKAKRALMVSIMNYHSIPKGKRLLFYGCTGPNIPPLDDVPGLQFQKNCEDHSYIYNERTIAIMNMPAEGEMSKGIYSQSHPMATTSDEGENSAVAIVHKFFFSGKPKTVDEKNVCIHSTDTDTLTIVLPYIEQHLVASAEDQNTVVINGTAFKGMIWINRGMRRFYKDTGKEAPSKAEAAKQGIAESSIVDKAVYVNTNLLYTYVKDKINNSSVEVSKHLKMPITNLMVPVFLGGTDFSHPIYNITLKRILEVYFEHACEIGPFLDIAPGAKSWEDVGVTEEHMSNFVSLLTAVYVSRHKSNAFVKHVEVNIHKWGHRIKDTTVLKNGALYLPWPVLTEYLEKKTPKMHAWSLEEYASCYKRILYCIFYNMHTVLNTPEKLPSLESMGYKTRQVRMDAPVEDMYRGKEYIIPENTDLVQLTAGGFTRVVCMPYRNNESHMSVSTTPASRT